jgi:hypothetical protein
MSGSAGTFSGEAPVNVKDSVAFSPSVIVLRSNAALNVAARTADGASHRQAAQKAAASDSAGLNEFDLRLSKNLCTMTFFNFARRE